MSLTSEMFQTPYYALFFWHDGKLHQSETVVIGQSLDDVLDDLENDNLGVVLALLCENGRQIEDSAALAEAWLAKRGQDWLDNHDPDNRFPAFIETHAARECSRMRDDYWTSNDEWKRHKRSYAA